MSSILEQYRISDFLEWDHDKRLVLSPYFQRGSVWSPDARIYLIDTILRQLPIPKIYMRTIIDPLSKRSIREVVDGQQRLRAIIEFADDKFQLSKRAGEFAGFKFSTLGGELQEKFLTYPLAVDQLINASDNLVLEVFARLNTYSVSLNGAEKRHAQYQGEFKWTVRNISRQWDVLWANFRVLSVRQRVRMLDDQLTAEMLGILLEGVRDGGEKYLKSLYSRYDQDFDSDGIVVQHMNGTLEFIVSEFAEYLRGTRLLDPPQLLMLFAAIAHALYGIPIGSLSNEEHQRFPEMLSNLDVARDNLLLLASIMEAERPPAGFEDFWGASKSSTQTISSRRTRFRVFLKALLPQPI